MSVQKTMSSIQTDLINSFISKKNKPFRTQEFCEFLNEHGFYFGVQPTASFLKKKMMFNEISLTYDYEAKLFVPPSVRRIKGMLCRNCLEYKNPPHFKYLRGKRSANCLECIDNLRESRPTDAFLEKIIKAINEFIIDQVNFSINDVCAKVYEDYYSNEEAKARRFDRVQTAMNRRISKMGLRYRYCPSIRLYTTSYVVHEKPKSVPNGMKFCYVCGEVKELAGFRSAGDGSYFARCDSCCAYHRKNTRK